MRSGFTMAAIVVSALVAAGVADAQTFDRRKPRTTTQMHEERVTTFAIPGRPYGRYTWRRVSTCDATWFSDGKLKTCAGIVGTERWRLESNADFADEVFWDPGARTTPFAEILSGSLLAVREPAGVELVLLPSRRRIVTRHPTWSLLKPWWSETPIAFLHGVAGGSEPVPLSRVGDDGSVGPPIPGSDARRAAGLERAAAPCAAAAQAAALPASEAVGGAGTWSEVLRLVRVDGALRPGEGPVAGDVTTRCRALAELVHVARRAADGTWQVLDPIGRPTTPATFVTAEAATSGARTQLGALGAADASAAAEAARLQVEAEARSRRTDAEMQASIERNRREIAALSAAGRHGEALQKARLLGPVAVGRVVLAWPDAPRETLFEAVTALERLQRGGPDWDGAMFVAIERRRDAWASCDRSYGAVAQGPSRWHSTAPHQRNMDVSNLRRRLGPAPRSGMNAVFDATRYEWVWVDFHSAGGVINVPFDGPAQMRDAAAHARCVAAARARR